MCIHEGKQCVDWDGCPCPTPCANCDKPLVIGFGFGPDGKQFFSKELLRRLEDGKLTQN